VGARAAVASQLMAARAVTAHVGARVAAEEPTRAVTAHVGARVVVESQLMAARGGPGRVVEPLMMVARDARVRAAPDGG
jgi:hypothetical protein